MTWELFGSWSGVVRVVVTAALSYTALIVLLRVTGKRTLSKMNAFDLIVTVALGSALATTILATTTPLAEGLAGMATLVLLQYAVTYYSVRSPTFESLVKAEPTLVFHHGRFYERAMRVQRLTHEEVFAAVRNSGVPSLGDDVSVVLETDGSLSVVRRAKRESESDAPSSLPDVQTGPNA